MGLRGDGGAVHGRCAHDDARRDPRRAGAWPDAARGDRIRARDPRGHGLAHLRDDDAARHRRAVVVLPARRAPGSGERLPPRTARAGGAPSPAAPARRARADRAAWRRRAARMRHVAGIRRRGIEPRAQDRRSHGCPGARPPRRDGRAGLRRREEQNGADRRGRDRHRARRRGPRTGGLGDLA